MKRIIILFLTLMVCSLIASSASLDHKKESTENVISCTDEFLTSFTENTCPAFLLEDANHILLVYAETNKYIVFVNELIEFSKEVFGENYPILKKLNKHIIALKKYRNLAKIKLNKFDFTEILDAKDWYETHYMETTDDMINSGRRIMYTLSFYDFKRN